MSFWLRDRIPYLPRRNISGTKFDDNTKYTLKLSQNVPSECLPVKLVPGFPKVSAIKKMPNAATS